MLSAVNDFRNIANKPIFTLRNYSRKSYEMKPVISALPALQPTLVVDISTGEIIDDWEEPVKELCEWVYAETVRIFETNKETVLEQSANLSGSANSYARQRGYKSEAMGLDRSIKAKSRINELVLYKLMSETASYSRNPNPRKQPHKFNRTLNLGAVDKQMVTLERAENNLILTWKCWDRELEFAFAIPKYVTQRNITKISLPVVSGKGFVFTIQENPEQAQGNNIAGVDLGRTQPYSLAIINERGALVANYIPSRQLTKTNLKRERILKEVKYLQAKTRAYEQLGLNTETLLAETRYKKNKASRIGSALVNQIPADIVKKTIRHEVKILHTENLKWATGTKYGSRWVHGQTSNKIEHTAARHGLKTKRVNPRNTSQTCHKCGSTITHNTKTRIVHCGNCKTKIDRDFNAAMNIAKNKKSCPVDVYRRNGDKSQETNIMVGLHFMNLQVPAVNIVNTT